MATSKQRREGDNENVTMVESPISAWERHGQSVLAGVALLILGWVGFTVNENSKNIPVLSTQVMGLERQVRELNSALATDSRDRYYARDAARDFASVYKELDRIRDDSDKFMKEQASRGPRIKALEDQIRILTIEVQRLRNDLKTSI